jgi:hypothetical protein
MILEAYHPAPPACSSVDRQITLSVVRGLSHRGDRFRVKTTRMAGFLARPYYTGRVPAQVLVGAVLAEAHDEWQVSERRYLSEGSMALPATPPADPKGGSHTSATHGIVSASPLTRSR